MAQRSHQYFSLRWNNYQNTMTSVFQQLREDLSFVDVTLSCEHGSLKAHKVINIWGENCSKLTYCDNIWMCLFMLSLMVVVVKIFLFNFFFFLFYLFRWFCQHVRHIFKNYYWKILANIQQLFCLATLYSPIWKRSSILYIVERLMSPNLNYRYVFLIYFRFPNYYIIFNSYYFNWYWLISM